MHLYVHVPFCRRRCSYCDFAIAVRRSVPGARFVDCVLQERAGAEARERAPTALDTLYLGGGTPSLLSPDVLARLLDALTPAPAGEVTLEVNPDDVSRGAAEAWVAMGITRFSVGVQSLDRDALAWMRRGHDPRQALTALETLRDAGAAHLSADIIFGLPGHRSGQPVEDARRVVRTGVDHLSAYGLTVEPGTPLGKWQGAGRRVKAGDQRYAREFLALHEGLAEEGFDHYEVSNYARPGGYSRHNRAYWASRPVVGLGPAAHSHVDGVRWWNLRDWARYDEAMAAGRSPVAGREVLTARERALEAIYLGLRTSEGLGFPAVDTLDEAFLARVLKRGWLAERDGRVVATLEGWLRLDDLVAGLATWPRSG